jgi:hypothetical protein
MNALFRTPKPLSRSLLAIGTCAALVGAATMVATAQPPQQGKVVETHAAKSRGTGADANVKRDTSLANSRTARIPAPPRKGGAKTRGEQAGELHVDNRTDLIIRIYVDGDYVGTVGPWGDVYGEYSCRTHTLYARAYFTDGSYSTWGPTTANLCEDYTWRLWP